MSALTWCGPSSRSTSFIALKIGRSGQPVQKPGGLPWTTLESSVATASGITFASRVGFASGSTLP